MCAACAVVSPILIDEHDPPVAADASDRDPASLTAKAPTLDIARVEVEG
jgi:hypothetical protein